jgi:hypothetical protein
MKLRQLYISCDSKADFQDWGEFKIYFSNGPVWKAENAAVGFDVLTTCQPSTVWCSRERLPAAAAQPTKVRQSL